MSKTEKRHSATESTSYIEIGDKIRNELPRSSNTPPPPLPNYKSDKEKDTWTTV